MRILLRQVRPGTLHDGGERTHYAGFDWARDHHDIIIVDRGGRSSLTSKSNTPPRAGSTGASGSPRWERLAACVETSQGVVVDSAKRYRERKVPSGNKTDRVDAWSLADALRVDGHGWKALARKTRSSPSCACSAATRSP